jgi:hypothetical protein
MFRRITVITFLSSKSAIVSSTDRLGKFSVVRRVHMHTFDGKSKVRMWLKQPLSIALRLACKYQPSQPNGW